MDLKTLCEKYSPYDHRSRLEKVFRDFDRVLVTSSFGTTSAILLHHLQQVQPEHPVVFIDTKFHFGETHRYKNTLSEQLGLNVLSIVPNRNENQFTEMDYTWAYQPDDCCYVNKVRPIDNLKKTHDVWISGMIGGASNTRKDLPIFREKDGIIRFYPFIDMTEEDAYYYRIVNELPTHPLEGKGYHSVGCTHCTRPGAGREGRWTGFKKTECGLHF